MRLQNVVVTTALRVQNSGADAASSLLWCSHDDAKRSVAEVFLAEQSDEKENEIRTRNEMRWEREMVGPLLLSPAVPEGVPAGVSCVAAALPEGAAVAPGGAASFEVQEVYTRAMRPEPEEATQISRQGMVYKGPMHITTPYPVATESTIVVYGQDTEEAQKDLLMAAPSEGAELGKGLVRWTFSKLSPWAPTEGDFQVRWVRDAPLLYTDRVVREVTVYPWTGVQEDIDFRVSNGGTRLKGGFSRYHHLKGGYVKATNEIKISLPQVAGDIYFRDAIGNISTSTVIRNAPVSNVRPFPSVLRPLEGTFLNAVPRYPILGGWKSSFNVGYTVPWASQVHLTPEGRHRLTVLFGSPLFPAAVAELEIRVVLPEGARNPKVTAYPGVTFEESEDTKVTWFDLRGRHVVVLKARNLVEDHSRKPIQVEFEYSMLWMIKEPLMVLAALLTIFLVGRLANADWTLVKDDAWQQRQAAKEASQNLRDVAVTVAKRDKAFKALEAALQRLVEAGDFSMAKSARKRESTVLRGLAEQLESATGRVGPGKLGEVAGEVLALEQQKEELFLSLFDRKVDFVQNKADPQQIEKDLAADERRLRQLQRESADFLVKLAQ